MTKHLPLYFESCSKKPFFLLSRVHFEILIPRKVFSFINKHKEFFIHTQKKEFCHAFWVDLKQERILGILKINKKYCVLECFTKKQAKKGKKWLETELKEAIRFKAYSYRRLSNPWREERTSLKEYLIHYYEKEWIHTPLSYLNNQTPLQSLKTNRSSLINLIEEMEKTLFLPYDFNRLRQRLNLNSICYLDKEIEKQKLNLQEEILECLNTAFRLLRVIEETETFSSNIIEPLISLTHLVDRLSEFAIFLDKKLCYKDLKKITSQLYEVFDKVEIQLKELLEAIPQKEKIIELYTDENWHHLEIINEEPFLSLPRSLAKEVMANWRGKAEEIILTSEMDLFSVLEKQPLEWIEAIAAFLNLLEGNKSKKAYVDTITSFLKKPSNLIQVVANLPEEAHGVLRVVLEAGGSFPYACLIRYFGNDIYDGFYWRIKPPRSAIGIIRARGLLFVGQMKRMGTLTKVAFIPSDLRPILRHLTTVPDNILRLPE
ncbi:MAG: hypothetical protein LWW95_03435 [Candidatus Desulfofervidus auxilii]|nr:hypothetical protein [Candidatus Desulfofervidus auxilii]